MLSAGGFCNLFSIFTSGLTDEVNVIRFSSTRSILASTFSNAISILGQGISLSSSQMVPLSPCALPGIHPPSSRSREPPYHYFTRLTPVHSRQALSARCQLVAIQRALITHSSLLPSAFLPPGAHTHTHTHRHIKPEQVRAR
ncbi:hypothetical protein LX36DRAFT_261274 [Colletotrichum falcatum]|nr:hypothetical protein LX36DRAFT_261274 [Colletotrichum falcatum]